MVVNFFSKPKPVNFIVLLGLFLCYFSLNQFDKEISFETAKELIGFIVLFVLFNLVVAKNKLTFENSFAFLFFVLLIGLFPKVIHIDKTFFTCLIILLFSQKLYGLQSAKRNLYNLFDGGLWLGIAFLVEPCTVMFGILFYSSIYLKQQFTYQTLLIPLIGYICVLFLFFTYCFWYDKTAVFYQLFDWDFSCNIDFYWNKKYLFSCLFVAVFTLYSLILKTPKALSVLNRFKKKWILTIIYLLISSVVIVLMPNKTGTELLLLLFPVAIILANGLELFQKKWISDVFLLLFFVCSILTNFI